MIKIIVDKDKLNAYYNERYFHNLLGIYSSWSEVTDKILLYTYNNNKIICNLWEFNTLINMFNSSLNNSSNNNPSPLFPEDPFTRIKYEYNSIVDINTYAIKHNIKINIPLKNYIDYVLLYEKIPKLQYKFIKYLYSCGLRYKLINSKDSQNNYIGKWTDSSTELSLFEKWFKDFETISPIINHNNHMIQNPLYLQYIDILDHIPDDN